MSATTIGWTPRDYPFGPGLVATVGDGTAELVPFLAGDGSGAVAGYALVRDFERSGFLRLTGLTLEEARTEAGHRIHGCAGSAPGAGGTEGAMPAPAVPAPASASRVPAPKLTKRQLAERAAARFRELESDS